MGLYDVFATDEKLERDGVWADYDNCRILIAHAGGSNKEYNRYAEKKLKPLRRAFQSGSISNERSEAFLIDIYAHTIIKDWVTKADGEWVSGIEGPDGDIIEFNKDNVVKTLTNLPNLFFDIQEMANSIASYRAKELELEGKN